MPVVAAETVRARAAEITDLPVEQRDGIGNVRPLGRGAQSPQRVNGRDGRAAEPAPPSSATTAPLRRQLLDVAWEIVAESGVESLSIRAVARRAGVSHAAPHHYFADKAELVRTLAVEGYDALTDNLVRSAQRFPDDPFLQLTATGIAYVRFAVDHPDIFRLMNRPEMRTPDGVVADHAARAVNLLEEVVTECQRTGVVRPGPARQWSFACWSVVHGLAVLIIDGLLERR